MHDFCSFIHEVRALMWWDPLFWRRRAMFNLGSIRHRRRTRERRGVNRRNMISIEKSPLRLPGPLKQWTLFALRTSVAMATVQHCDTEVEDEEMHRRTCDDWHGGSDVGEHKSEWFGSPPLILLLLSNSLIPVWAVCRSRWAAPLCWRSSGSVADNPPHPFGCECLFQALSATLAFAAVLHICVWTLVGLTERSHRFRHAAAAECVRACAPASDTRGPVWCLLFESSIGFEFMMFSDSPSSFYNSSSHFLCSPDA